MHRCKVFFPIPIPLFMNALSNTYWINSFLSGETLFHQYFIRKMLLRKIIRLIWIVLTFLSHKTNFTPTKKPPKHAINKCRMTLTFKHFTQNTPIQFKMAISDFNLNEYRYIVNIICVYKNSRTIGPTSWEWMIEELYRSWTNPAFTPLTLKVVWTQLFTPWTDYESSIINTC